MLRKIGAPVVTFVTLQSDILDRHVEHSVDNKMWDEIVDRNVKKYTKKGIHSVNEFKTRFKGYTRDYTHDDIVRVHEIMLKQKNTATSSIRWNAEEIEKKLLLGEEIKPSESEFLDIVNESMSKCVQNNKSAGSLAFIPGEKMIEICFEIASHTGIPLALQKFFRPGGYEKYSEMLDKHKKVQTWPSHVDIWNVDKFPQYDKNVLFGAKYILNL